MDYVNRIIDAEDPVERRERELDALYWKYADAYARRDMNALRMAERHIARVRHEIRAWLDA